MAIESLKICSNYLTTSSDYRFNNSMKLFLSSSSSNESTSELDSKEHNQNFSYCFDMSGSVVEVISTPSTTTPKTGRRSMALSDIDPKYVSQSGIWEASEVETSRGGSIRIQHLTAVIGPVGNRPTSSHANATTSQSHSSSHANVGNFPASRFPKLEECAHFHYDILELPHIKVSLHEDQPTKSIIGTLHDEDGEGDSEKYISFSIEVVSNGQCWIFCRTLSNLIKLDEQLHRCVWDRKFSMLENISKVSSINYFNYKSIVSEYLERLSSLPTNQITCGTVLSWLEIDNRGRHIISSDDAALNTPAVAAALGIKSYTAQAPDELTFRVGELISVIDMPPPEESIWLRGKLTRESQGAGINFEVGFFPREYVEIIGEKGKYQPGGVSSMLSCRKLSKVSINSSSTPSPTPDKPVLRKHGKIISFFRSMMSRPEKRVLQQKGILKERVFNCDLAEHLSNTGSEIPIILKTCAEFIEYYGISDGIYRVSGSLRNTQRLRRLFDAEEVPNLASDEGIRQDVHAVSSVLKQYFRELPNPLCTYQLYEKFVLAISPASNSERFAKIREVIKELPPPHYRTLEYLMLHLSKMTTFSEQTGMTAQNMAIVWAPNLIRCRDLEGGSVAEFKGVSNHVIVTEFVIRYASRFFGSDTSPLPTSTWERSPNNRPESLLLSSSSPMKLMSLEAAKEKLGRANGANNSIDVGGGPASLPPLYHTVLEQRRGSIKSKGGSGGGGSWKNFFSRNRSFSKSPRKTTAADIRVLMNTATNLKDGSVPGFGNKLRPVRSEESLVSPYENNSGVLCNSSKLENTAEVDESEIEFIGKSTSSPSSPVSDVHAMISQPLETPISATELENSKTHNRSVSHDSYFELSMKRLGMIPKDIQEEDDSLESSHSKLPMDMGSIYEETDESREDNHSTTKSIINLCPNSPSLSHRPSHLPLSPPHISPQSTKINSFSQLITQEQPRPKPRLSKLKDSQVQTSTTRVHEIGVSTMDDTPIIQKSYSSTSVVSEYRFPTFNESERKEVNMSEKFDMNSSVDESSTDTTPGADPYSITNIIYSPLLNENVSPTSSSSSSSSCDEDETVKAKTSQTSALYVNLTPPKPRAHEYENVPSHLNVSNNSIKENEKISSTHENKNFSEHKYANSSAEDDLSRSRCSEAAIAQNLYETNIYEEIREGEESSSKNKYEDIEMSLDENIHRWEIGSNNQEKIENDLISSPASTVYEKVEFPIQTHAQVDETKENVEDIEDFKIDSSPTTNTYSNIEPLPNSSTENATIIEIIHSPSSNELSEEQEPLSSSISDSAKTEDELHFIDSPVLGVDNPLYGMEFTNDNSLPISQPHLLSLSDIEIKLDTLEPKTHTQNETKVLNRSHSAPLSVTNISSVSLNSCEKEENAKKSEEDISVKSDGHISNKNMPMEASASPAQKVLISKRLSEPSLNNSDKSSWKISDAKRLAHRKSSVRELLSKFESSSHESLTPSPSPSSLPNSQNTQNSPSSLPRSTPKLHSSTNDCSESLLRDRRERNSGRQHHRFSMGDILMSRSGGGEGSQLESADLGTGQTITRSDTYPELRNEATKENEGVETVGGDKKKSPIPDKVLQLFEVVNTTVDNNDPGTRERIEKYKNNRRLFLREKFSGVLEQQQSSHASKELKDNSSSNDNIFMGSSFKDKFSASSLASESPRKRALSEDISHQASRTQFKSFKGEEEAKLSSTKVEFLTLPTKKSHPRAIEPLITSTGLLEHLQHPPLGASSKLNIKTFNKSMSSPGPASLEGSLKSHYAPRPVSGIDSGKKIKDIAAFFERKQF